MQAMVEAGSDARQRHAAPRRRKESASATMPVAAAREARSSAAYRRGVAAGE